MYADKLADSKEMAESHAKQLTMIKQKYADNFRSQRTISMAAKPREVDTGKLCDCPTIMSPNNVRADLYWDF